MATETISPAERQARREALAAQLRQEGAAEERRRIAACLRREGDAAATVWAEIDAALGLTDRDARRYAAALHLLADLLVSGRLQELHA